MATHDEEDVRTINHSTNLRPRTVDLSVAPIKKQEASIPIAIANPVTGAISGSRFGGGYGALAGALAGAGYYLYNNYDRLKQTLLPLAGIVAAPTMRIYNKLGSYFYPDEAPADTSTAPAAPAAPTDSVGSTPAPAPTPEPERNDSTSQRRPSFRERLGDRIAGRNRGQEPTSGSTPPNNNQNGSFLGRMLWETKNNNFGQNWWQWRNVGRVGLGLSYPARETVWPAVGKGLKYMAVGPDSVPTPATPQVVPAAPTVAPVDSNYISKDQYIAPTDTLDF